MQMSSSECHALETPKHLLTGSQERGRQPMFRKSLLAIRASFLILERKHVTDCRGTRLQLCSAENVETISSRQLYAEIAILLHCEHAAFCPGTEIFLGKRCGQRAALSCRYNQPVGDYYQPVLDYWENEKVV